MRLLLFLFFFLKVTVVQSALQPDATSRSRPLAVKSLRVKHDSSKVVFRHFDAQKLEEYSKQKEFIYEEDHVTDLNWWSRFWRSFWRFIDSLFSSAKGSGDFIKYLVIAALIGLVVFIALKLKGINLVIFAKRSKEIDVPYHESDDNIHEINFDNEIEQAVNQGNYRLAVRLLYLRSLKKLSDQELIHWEPGKTNQTYVNELKEPYKKMQFSKLTRQFEYIWYGDFFIDKALFKQVRDTFEQFNLQRS